MENLIEIVSVPIIVAVVYLLLKIYKYWVNSEKAIRVIPGLAGLLGTTLGLITFYAAPDIMPASNFLMAMLIGGSSGFCATGINQMFKQLSKSDITGDDNSQSQTENNGK